MNILDKTMVGFTGLHTAGLILFLCISDREGITTTACGLGFCLLYWTADWLSHKLTGPRL